MLSSRKTSPAGILSPSENYNSSNRKGAALAPSALLFYKPRHPSTTNSQLNSRVKSAWCENHQNTNASYYSCTHDADEEAIYYCRKCAQLLIEQGFEVHPIQESGSSNSNQVRNSFREGPRFPYPEREGEIQGFLKVLQEREQMLEGSESQIKDILIASEEFYGQQIEEINEYFEAVIQSLELQKNKCYNHILLERQNAEKFTRETMQKVLEGEKEIQAMMSDIQDNLDSVFSITWDNYRLVMEAFEGRLREVDKVMESIEREGIRDVEFRKIEFAGVPDSINSISEIIIQNSFGGGSVLEMTGTVDFEDSCSEHKSPFNHIKSKSTLCDAARSGQQPHHRHNSLVFSFDGDAMRECGNLDEDQEASFNSENRRNLQGQFLRKASQSEGLEDSSQDEQVVMRGQKYGRNLFCSEGVERVEGIQEVQEVDVLEMPDDYLLQ